MAEEAHGGEGGGLVFHPLDQFLIKPLFGDGPLTWYTPTNATLWMAIAVLCIFALFVLVPGPRAGAGPCAIGGRNPVRLHLQDGRGCGRP